MTAGPWPRADLIRRVRRALDTAEAAIALVGSSTPQVDLGAMEAAPDKIIAETAIFLRVAAGVPEVADRVDELVRALAPHARHSRIAIGIALHPALARDYAVAHTMLSDIGYPDAGVDRALAAALASPVALGRERVPYRELEQHWLASLSCNAAFSADVIARTALARDIDLLSGSRDDVYALTHAIFYATDFGGRRVPLPRSASDIVAMADSALAGALDDDDFDLAGELLLARPCLGEAWNTMSSFAFAVLARVEDEVGVLPSLSLDGSEYERQPVEARAHYVAATAYHTAYVMGLLCSALLRGEELPQALPRIEAASSPHERQWQRDLESLEAHPREQCAGFLLDVALRRSVRRLDLGALSPLLMASLETGVALTPLSVQAAGLMRRLAGATEFVSTVPRAVPSRHQPARDLQTPVDVVAVVE